MICIYIYIYISYTTVSSILHGVRLPRAGLAWVFITNRNTNSNNSNSNRNTNTNSNTNRNNCNTNSSTNSDSGYSAKRGAVGGGCSGWGVVLCSKTAYTLM